jgi:hypothetical protein
MRKLKDDYKTREDHILDLENQLFGLFGISDKDKKDRMRSLLNQIITHSIIRTNTIFNPTD